MQQGKRNCVAAALSLRSGFSGAKERLACWPWLQQATRRTTWIINSSLHLGKEHPHPQRITELILPLGWNREPKRPGQNDVKETQEEGRRA